MPQKENEISRRIGTQSHSGQKTEESQRLGKSWFLGIGINTYQAFPQLNNAVKDVEDILELLMQRYDVEADCALLLKDEEATREAIIDQLDRLKKEIKEEDKLLIYYSGHGHLDDSELGYWIPYDAKKGKTANYIRNSTIRDYIRVIRTRHTLLISDSCFSGSLFSKGGSRAATAIDQLEQRKSRWAICSGRHDQEVNDGEPGKNSPFAKSIIKMLQDNSFQKLNVAKLAGYVLEVTAANYDQLPEGNPLSMVGHEGGQYVFRLKVNADQEDQKRWQQAKAENRIHSLRAYVSEFPKSKHHEEAKQLLAAREQADKAAWVAIKDQESLIKLYTYRDDFPDGNFVQEAINKIASLRLRRMATQKEEQAKAPPSKIRKEEGTKDSPPLIQKEEKVKGPTTTIVEKPGIFTDPRDGQTYKTVELNGQVWLAENLNFKVRKSWWYQSKSKYGDVYGRLYTWEAAQKACPPGWRLPTDEEWRALAHKFGGYAESRTGFWGNTKYAHHGEPEKAHEALIKGGGSGFEALFGGERDHHGFFSYIRGHGYYWSATKDDEGIPYCYFFNSYTDILERKTHFEEMGFSVRCIQDRTALLPVAEENTQNRKIVKDLPTKTQKEKVVKVPPTKTQKEKVIKGPPPNIIKTPGIFTDPRDGQAYKTVELNGKLWLAENLNFKIRQSWYYEGKSKNGEVYGRLYTWKSAQKACPPGWRLPTDEEWKALAHKFGGYKEVRIGFWDNIKYKNHGQPEKAYKALIQGGSSGFEALLGGKREGNGYFDHIEVYGTYWSVTKDDEGNPYYYSFQSYTETLSRQHFGVDWAYSVRCIQK